MPANKALGAQKEAKKDLVDILKMYMPGNLNQIPAYMQPNRLHTVQGTAVGKNKALTAPKTENTKRCKRSTYAQVTERSQRSKPKGKGCTYLPWKPNAGPTLTAVGRKFDTT